MAHNWKRQASVAYGCALTRLALNLYLYFEELPPSGKRGGEEKLCKRFMELLGLYLEGKQTEILESVGCLRDQIKEQMQKVVAYSDAFQIYEYALNRVERRFVKGRAIEVDEEAFVGNLMRYIAAFGDAAIQNQRIQQIVGQLPVRFTRQKYFGMVHDALTSYIGGDQAALDDVMYLLRSGSMTGVFAKDQEAFGELNELLAKVEKLSFKEMDAVEYENARTRIFMASELLEDMSHHCVCLQEMANDLYILCLTGEDGISTLGEQENAWKILDGLRCQYEQEIWEIPSELFEMLPLLEGVQEEYYEKYQRLDISPELIEKDGILTSFGIVDRLMSSSTFASLEGSGRKGSVSLSDVESAADKFFAELGPVFSSCQKPVMRAIMAMTLSYLPVFFNSPDEIRNYIRNCLGGCSDQAEKEACMDLLLQLMESDGYDLV